MVCGIPTHSHLGCGGSSTLAGTGITSIHSKRLIPGQQFFLLQRGCPHQQKCCSGRCQYTATTWKCLVAMQLWRVKMSSRSGSRNKSFCASQLYGHIQINKIARFAPSCMNAACLLTMYDYTLYMLMLFVFPSACLSMGSNQSTTATGSGPKAHPTSFLAARRAF